METKEIFINNKIRIGGDNRIVLIAGPCVIESERSTIEHAKKIKEIAEKNSIPFIFKTSYDKANRTSVNSYRGPGFKKGIKILEKIKNKIKVSILSDVHEKDQVDKIKDIVDIIQIPAFLCRQTDLILKVAETKKAINVKKGQFLSPNDMRHVINKIESTGNRKIILTERGVSFGYNNLVSDFRSLIIMRNFGYPVCFDATHSVQLPGKAGDSSGGQSEFVFPLAMAAVSVGVDAIFVEVHENPKKALSDGANMIPLNKLEKFINSIKIFEKAHIQSGCC